MNESNTRYYLQCRLEELAKRIATLQSYIKGAERNIDDWHNEIANLKVHYTSLLNTALAYGLTEEQMEDDGYATLKSD